MCWGQHSATLWGKKCYASCQAVPPNHSNIISHCSALSPKERMFPITLDIMFNLPNVPWQPTNHSRCYHTSRHLHFPNTGSEKEAFYVSKRSVKLWPSYLVCWFFFLLLNNFATIDFPWWLAQMSFLFPLSNHPHKAGWRTFSLLSLVYPGLVFEVNSFEHLSKQRTVQLLYSHWLACYREEQTSPSSFRSIFTAERVTKDRRDRLFKCKTIWGWILFLTK